MREEYKYIQCRTKKKCLETDYDNVVKEDNTALHFPSFEIGDGVQQLMPSMLDNEGLGEWELHTVEDMRLNYNHQGHIKYWSRNIIKSIRWFMRQLAYAEHLINTPQRCVNSDLPPKPLYTETHTTDWWWETQVSRDTRG
jgi:hypothetical protein